MPRRQRVDTAEELLHDDEVDSEAQLDEPAAAAPSPQAVRVEPRPTAAPQRKAPQPGSAADDVPGSPEASASVSPPPQSAADDDDEFEEDEDDSARFGEDATEQPDRGPALPPGVVIGQFFRRLNARELAALGIFVVVVLLGAVLFFKFLSGGGTDSGAPAATRGIALPVSGARVKLSEVDLYWRDRAASDSGRQDLVIVPEARLKLDPATAGTGYLRARFADGDGEIRGDVTTVKFENGRFVDSGRGEKVSADGTEVSLPATDGFASAMIFSSYLGNEDPRWTFLLEEGADYSKGPWTTLAFVRFPNEKK